MNTKEEMVQDYDAVLDAKFGAEGSEQRAIAEEMAYAFYTGKIILDARREAKMTQSELAKRANVTKSYISANCHSFAKNRYFCTRYKSDSD